MLSSLSDPSPARKMVRKTLTHFEGIFGRQIKAINTIGKYRKHGRKLSQWVWYHQISATAQWRCSQFGRRVGSEVSGKQGQVESFCGRQSSLGWWSGQFCDIGFQMVCQVSEAMTMHVRWMGKRAIAVNRFLPAPGMRRAASKR